MAAPLVMGAASMGAFGGQVALTNRLGHNAGNRAVRKQMTALAIGGSIDPDAVRISHLTRTESVETWSADTPSGRYLCSVGRGRTDVSCVRA
jgi:hypothetical protein